MNKGVANIGRTNKVDAVVVPAPTVTGARSGTSLSGTFVELGGALSPLLHNTTIEMGLFDFLIQDAFNEYLFFDRASAYAILGDQNQAASVRTEMANGQVLIGDIFPFANGSVLGVNDGLEQLFFQSSLTSTMLLLDGSNKLYQIGDVLNANNGTLMSIDDTAQIFTVESAGNDMLILDQAGHTFQMGDIGLSGLGSTLSIVDGSETLTFSTTAGGVLDFNLSSRLFQYGDLGGTGNSSVVIVRDAQRQLQFFANAGGDRFLDLNGTGGLFQMGDIDSSFGGTTFTVDDTAGNCQTSSNLLVNGSLGTGGVVTNTSQIHSTLAAFASNAAAIVGGLVVGDFYRISVAGTSAVAVVE